MIDLLESYSISEIIIFIIIICFAIKEGVEFFDWSKDRLKQSFNKDQEQQDKDDDVQEQIDKLKEDFLEKEKYFKEQNSEINKKIDTLYDQMEELIDNIDLLLASDKDDIKSYIVEKHHLFCYEQKWIDDYSLDCLEKRYTHYKDEGGNSFIKDLMNEIRALPKKPL